MTLDLANSSAKDFILLLHQSFYSVLDTARLELELMEVREYPRKILTQNRSPFILLFRSSSTRVIPQQIHRLEQETIGAMNDVFLIPVGADRDGCCYQAIFN